MSGSNQPGYGRGGPSRGGPSRGGPSRGPGGPPRGPPPGRQGAAGRGALAVPSQGDTRAFSGPSIGGYANIAPRPSSTPDPFASRESTPAGSQGPSRIDRSDMTLEQKYPASFVDIGRANNAANSKTDSKVVYNFKSYDIWIAQADPDAALPTRDELASLEKSIMFTLDWEMRKHMLVFINGHHICRIILAACPEIITNSTKFRDLRNYAMNNFRTWKSMHLYRDFYGWVRKLKRDFPHEFQRDFNDAEQLRGFIRFIESKIDETSFATIFGYVAKQLNWRATIKHRSVWTDNTKTKHSPFMLIKQIMVSFSRMLAELADLEDALNPGRTWEDVTKKDSGDGNWNKDNNHRNNVISKAFDALTLEPGFQDIKLHDFTWNTPEELPDKEKRSKARAATKRKSDADLLSKVMINVDDDDDGPPAAKSPRSGNRTPSFGSQRTASGGSARGRAVTPEPLAPAIPGGSRRTGSAGSGRRPSSGLFNVQNIADVSPSAGRGHQQGPDPSVIDFTLRYTGINPSMNPSMFSNIPVRSHSSTPPAPGESAYPIGPLQGPVGRPEPQPAPQFEPRRSGRTRTQTLASQESADQPQTRSQSKGKGKDTGSGGGGSSSRGGRGGRGRGGGTGGAYARRQDFRKFGVDGLIDDENHSYEGSHTMEIDGGTSDDDVADDMSHLSFDAADDDVIDPRARNVEQNTRFRAGYE